MRQDVAKAIDEGLAMTEEGEVLMAFEQWMSKQSKGKKINPKKLKAFATRIAPLCAPHILNGLIRNVLTIRDPEAYLLKCFGDIHQYAEIIKDFTKAGNHGMIQIQRQCYPVKLICPDVWLTDGNPWHPEDERLIGADACNKWMKDNDKGYFHGLVVLFSEFGFSGIPREFEMRCTKNVSGLNRYPGTRYYTR